MFSWLLQIVTSQRFLSPLFDDVRRPGLNLISWRFSGFTWLSSISSLVIETLSPGIVFSVVSSVSLIATSAQPTASWNGFVTEWPHKQEANMSPVPVNSTIPSLFSSVINLLSVNAGICIVPRVPLSESDKNPRILLFSTNFVDVITTCCGPSSCNLSMQSQAVRWLSIGTPWKFELRNRDAVFTCNLLGFKLIGRDHCCFFHGNVTVGVDEFFWDVQSPGIITHYRVAHPSSTCLLDQVGY